MIGKLLYNDINVFSVPKKNILVDNMLHHHKRYKNFQLGGKLHVWITLGDGTIIEPSFMHFY